MCCFEFDPEYVGLTISEILIINETLKYISTKQ